MTMSSVGTLYSDAINDSISCSSGSGTLTFGNIGSGLTAPLLLIVIRSLSSDRVRMVFSVISSDLRIFAGIITALLLPTLVSVIACVRLCFFANI